jgi:hypothetical protein
LNCSCSMIPFVSKCFSNFIERGTRLKPCFLKIYINLIYFKIKIYLKLQPLLLHVKTRYYTAAFAFKSFSFWVGTTVCRRKRRVSVCDS